MQIYIADNDDVYPPRRICVNPTQFLSWKQVAHPYLKNTQIFTDPVNPAARFLDDTSDAAIRAAWGNTIPAGAARFARGYAMNNIAFYLNGRWDVWECATSGHNTLNGTQLDEPATVAYMFEHKYPWVDSGPYLSWENGFDDPDGVRRINTWSFGGGKWSEKAMSLVFFDSHAKRTSHSGICGKAANALNEWGYRRGDLATAWAGDMSWLDNYCTTMPAAVK
jgi:hypothetical protein